MEILKTKKTKYEQVSEIMDKQGYILDKDSVKIFGEGKLYCVSEHVRKWKKLQADREFFKHRKIDIKKKGYRCHLVHIENEPENSFWKVGKEFWNEIVL